MAEPSSSFPTFYGDVPIHGPDFYDQLLNYTEMDMDVAQREANVELAHQGAGTLPVVGDAGLAHIGPPERCILLDPTDDEAIIHHLRESLESKHQSPAELPPELNANLAQLDPWELPESHRFYRSGRMWSSDDKTEQGHWKQKGDWEVVRKRTILLGDQFYWQYIGLKRNLAFHKNDGAEAPWGMTEFIALNVFDGDTFLMDELVYRRVFDTTASSGVINTKPPASTTNISNNNGECNNELNRSDIPDSDGLHHDWEAFFRERRQRLADPPNTADTVQNNAAPTHQTLLNSSLLRLEAIQQARLMEMRKWMEFDRILRSIGAPPNTAIDTAQNNAAPTLSAASGKRPRTDEPNSSGSDVWQHYTRIYIKIPKDKAGSKKKKDSKKLMFAVCHYCHRVFLADSKQGTSHHKRHAEACQCKNSQPGCSYTGASTDPNMMVRNTAITDAENNSYTTPLRLDEMLLPGLVEMMGTNGPDLRDLMEPTLSRPSGGESHVRSLS